MAAYPKTVTPVILGEGTMSCGQWLEFRRTREGMAAVSEAWVRGFLTGYGFAYLVNHREGPAVGSGTDPFGNNAWIDNYCRDHPLNDLSEASAYLWNTLPLRAVDDIVHRPHP
jgi:hypothetical protein